MSKVLPATCEDSVVTCEGVPIPSARILSEGIGESEGVLVLEEDRADYIAKTSPDLKATIEKLIAALGNASAALSAIDNRVYVIASGSPDSFGPPVAAGDISALNEVISDLEEFKEVLK